LDNEFTLGGQQLVFYNNNLALEEALGYGSSDLCLLIPSKKKKKKNKQNKTKHLLNLVGAPKSR
jgi:hypothetical protein